MADVPEGPAPYIIQMRLRDEDERAQLLDWLRELGVLLDESYGVIPIDPAAALYVSRGLVPARMVSAIEQDDRVALYPEVGIRPT